MIPHDVVDEANRRLQQIKLLTEKRDELIERAETHGRGIDKIGKTITGLLEPYAVSNDEDSAQVFAIWPTDRMYEHLVEVTHKRKPKRKARCIVYRLRNITPHPTHEALVVADVGGYQVVIGKHYDQWVLGVFLPDGAIIPENIAKDMWVFQRLAGKDRNRVKAKQLHGVLSEGLFYGSRYYEMVNGVKVYKDSPAWNAMWTEGEDVTSEIKVLVSDDPYSD